MTALTRIWMSAAILAVALAAEGGLLAHMMFGPTNTYSPLQKPLAELPTTLLAERVGQPSLEWKFQTNPAEKSIRSRLPFEPLDLVFRRFQSSELKLDGECYIVHAENGEDRKHHPEICIRDVLQVPEVAAGRAVVWLDGDEQKPVQRFCFQAGPAQTTTIYYWHYTFAPLEQERQSWLQTLYQTFSRSPPSVTVQVTTTASADQWPAIEKNLLVPLESLLRSELLPPRAKMGCDRLPIALAGKQ